MSTRRKAPPTSGKPAKDDPGRIPPNDLSAEAAVLSHVFLSGSTSAVRHILRPQHFFSEPNAWVFRAQLSLEAEGTRIDLVTVRAYLDSAGKLSLVGVSYLAKIYNADLCGADLCSPDLNTASVEAHAKIVADKWRVRMAISTCQQFQAEGYGVNGQSNEYLQRALTALSGIASTTTPAFMDPGLFVERLRVPPRRLSTGLPALDKAFRGGVPVGIVWTIVGAPGSCKTTLAYQATMTMRDQGALVCVLAYDEPPASMLVRLGRHIGLDRDRIESGAPECMDAIEAHSRTHDWLLVDGMGEVPVSIDAAADELLRRSNGRPMVLMVDSIQRAWVDGIEDVDSPRQQVDMIVRALRRAAARGILIIATCEAARGLYRGGAREGKINAIAAGKESGSIEYRSDALLVLDAKEPDDTEEGHVVLSGTWAKNRIRSSKATTLWFVLDRERSVLSECDAPIDEEAPTSGNDRRPRKPKDSTPGKEELMRAALAVEAYVRTEPGCGKNEIRDAVKGFSHDLKNSAVQWLERAGRIESRPPAKKGRGRPSECWFITPSGKEAAHGFAHETGGANRDEK